jgi:hypothetical protein
MGNYYTCRDCGGTMNGRYCEDCGFDEMQFCNEWEAYVSADDVELDDATRWQYMRDRRTDDQEAA